MPDTKPPEPPALNGNQKYFLDDLGRRLDTLIIYSSKGQDWQLDQTQKAAYLEDKVAREMMLELLREVSYLHGQVQEKGAILKSIKQSYDKYFKGTDEGAGT